MPKTIHGYRINARNSQKDPTYSSWSSMKTRCLNKNAGKTHYIGVTICDRWLVFENFLTDMGERPEGMSLDRINPNGNYNPENCRWTTPLIQSRNKRKFSGVTVYKGKYRARIGQVFLGHFENFFDAVCARKSAENKLWGTL